MLVGTTGIALNMELWILIIEINLISYHAKFFLQWK